MTHLDIVRQRLSNQQISQQLFEKPEDVVRWLGAVQSQDYVAAKWAVGLRMQHATDNVIEQAVAAGTILRTHVMRPTWHFVSPNDIRWLLALTAPRVNAANASRYRQLELDDAVFLRTNAALIQALQGGKQLTRPELVSVFQQAGIAASDGQRYVHILMHAELDGIICSGAMRGKQYTYALLDERIPSTRTLDHDEALAELTGRYFMSHGPATLHDFVWWSGLTVADARIGLEMVSSQFVNEVVDGKTYWFSPSLLSANSPATVYLLPNFDEYIVGYTDRRAIFDVSHAPKLATRSNVLFNHTIVIDGQVVGTWKRTIKNGAVMLTPNFFVPLNKDETDAFMMAARHFEAFFKTPF